MDPTQRAVLKFQSTQRLYFYQYFYGSLNSTPSPMYKVPIRLPNFDPPNISAPSGIFVIKTYASIWAPPIFGPAGQAYAQASTRPKSNLPSYDMCILGKGYYALGKEGRGAPLGQDMYELETKRTHHFEHYLKVHWVGLGGCHHSIN